MYCIKKKIHVTLNNFDNSLLFSSKILSISASTHEVANPIKQQT